MRLNEKDPAHAEVIRQLEQQEPHSKGRFIVNAILHYIHCSETPDISMRQAAPDRAEIEAIVRDILRQQQAAAVGEKTVEASADKDRQLQSEEILAGEPAAEEIEKADANEDMRNLIKGTLSAFRINS